MTELDIRLIYNLRGPNIWTNSPALEAWVDLGDLKDTSSDIIKGFSDRIKRWFPTMIEHRCSIGERGGFFQRLDEGTWAGHILEHVALELQTLAGHEVGFGRTRETCVDGSYKVVIEYHDVIVAESCLREAREILMAAYSGKEYNIADAIERMKVVVDRNGLGPSTLSIVEAAKSIKIPWRRLHENINIIQFGQGVNQRRICMAETDRTHAVADHIAAHTDYTRKFLRRAGIPAAMGVVVKNVAEAMEAAKDYGESVVVRPSDIKHGPNVFSNLTTQEQVERSYLEASKEDLQVIVEPYIVGNEYRVLIIDKKLVSASLVNLTNSQIIEDVTSFVHPKNHDYFIMASQIVGLDICGVDVVCQDISKDLNEQGGVITGICTSPKLNLHTNLSSIGIEILEMLYPVGKNARIPVIGITGTRGKTITLKLITYLLSQSTSKFISSSTSEGLHFGERFTSRKDGARIEGQYGVLLHTSSEIAICEASAEGILMDGIGFDQCDVAVVINVLQDDLGLCYIDTLERLVKVHRCLVDIVPSEGTSVLNADDDLVASMSKYSKGHILYFSQNASNPLVAQHCINGGKAIFIREDSIYLAERCIERRLCKLTEISSKLVEYYGTFIADILAAVGAVWAYGLNDQQLIDALTK